MRIARLWIGRAGMEPLGRDGDGTPLLGDADGVEPMRLIEGVRNVEVIGWPEREEDW